MENSIDIFQKIKNKVTLNNFVTRNPSSGNLLPNLKTFIHQNICTPMFIAALFTVTETWKQP